MACIYTEHETLPVVEIRLVGRITDHDMDEIIPKLEAFIEKHDTIRLLEVIERFDGFDPSTILDGMKFDFKHLKDVTHVALVSDIPWISILTRAAAVISPITHRVFTLEQRDEATAWIEAPD